MSLNLQGRSAKSNEPLYTFLALFCFAVVLHYNDAIMSVMASQITSFTIVYSSVYSGADQRKRTARQINGTFKNIPSSDVTVIAAGTNNIESQTIDEITNELKQTIESVARKRRGKVVLMSEIPPRFDKVHLNE